MKALRLILILAGALALAACQSFYFPDDKGGSRKQELMAEEARARLASAAQEMAAGHLLYAREMAAAMTKHPVVGEEAKVLTKEIDLRLRERLLKMQKEVSDKQALQEVEEREILPEKYNTTIGVEGEAGPFEVAPGPMDDLLNRRVNFQIENADLQALLVALSQVDGLNVMADDALEAQGTVTISVTNVPLKEILSYISRNMGLEFVVGENMIWITAAEDDEAKGPKLVTEIIKLRKGYIPGTPESAGGGDADGGRGQRGGGGGFGAEAGAGGESGGLGGDDLDEALLDFLEGNPDNPEDAMYKIYRNRNLLVIRNTRENIRLAQEIIKEFDRDPKQVLIEARFVTIAQGDLTEFGTKINDLKKGTPAKAEPNPEDFDTQQEYEFALENWRRAVFTDDSDGIRRLLSNTAAFAAKEAGPFVNLGGVLDGFQYDIVLSMLHKIDNTSTLNAPRVTVVNNQTAKLHQGDVKYYFEEFEAADSNGSTANDGGTVIANDPILVPVGAPTKLDLGLTFSTTPSIGNDGQSVSLSLNVKITDFLGFTNEFSSSSGDNEGFAFKLPNTSETDIQTNVIVNSGETVVLGGQITAQNELEIKKVPFLGDLPFIGFFFRHEYVNREPKHLLIFVTAKIVDPDGRFNVLPEKLDNAGAAVPAESADE